MSVYALTAVFEARAELAQYRNPDVTFFPAALEVSTRTDAEGAVGSFIDETIAKLEADGLRGTGAQIRWNAVQEARQSPEQTLFCEAAGALRIDPHTVDDGAAKLIEQSASLFDGEALLEFLSGIGRARSGEALAWIEAVESRPAYDSRVPRLRELAEEVARSMPVQASEPGWSLGYRRALAAREALGLSQSDRLSGLRVISQRLGSNTFRLAPSVNGVRALRSQRREVEHVHLRTHGDHDEARTGHSFAFARAVGDAICFPEPGRFVINELRDAHRQAAGRAFAAEFLASVDEVRSMLDDGKDNINIANEFGVAPQAIEHQLENEDRIRATRTTPQLSCA